MHTVKGNSGVTAEANEPWSRHCTLQVVSVYCRLACRGDLHQSYDKCWVQMPEWHIIPNPSRWTSCRAVLELGYLCTFILKSTYITNTATSEELFNLNFGINAKKLARNTMNFSKFDFRDNEWNQFLVILALIIPVFEIVLPFTGKFYCINSWKHWSRKWTQMNYPEWLKFLSCGNFRWWWPSMGKCKK